MNTQPLARTPEAVVRKLRKDAIDYAASPPLERGVIGAMIGNLNKYLGGDVNRRLCLYWLFRFRGPEEDNLDELSTKSLETGEWYAIHEWMGMFSDGEKNWLPTAQFALEAALVLTEVIKCYAKIPWGFRTRMGLPEPDPGLLQLVGELGGIATALTDEEGYVVPETTGAKVPIERYQKKHPLVDILDADGNIQF